jgi:hypothetical protein
MALAAVVSDKSWYFIEGYSKRGDAMVKVLKRGPFEADPETAAELIRNVVMKTPTLEYVKYRWSVVKSAWEKIP